MSTDTSRPGTASADAAPAGAQPAGLEKVSVRQTRRVTGTAFLAWTIAVYDFILFGTLLPDISRDFGWDTSESLLVSTLVSVGTRSSCCSSARWSTGSAAASAWSCPSPARRCRRARPR
ncbi:hypothetical protein [Clavibacter nebraskensis]|uniref:hypothetical protein n=1 Tax=Clavibacter nebraskensis TaxID=31963 RepID=UPI003F4BD2CA